MSNEKRDPCAGDMWLGVDGPDYLHNGKEWIRTDFGISIEEKKWLLLAGWGERWRENDLNLPTDKP